MDSASTRADQLDPRTDVKIIMTLMVRDEADVVGTMLEHHRTQGIDHVVVTDNGSIDGTTEILQRFEAEGFATLWHDPVHRKQQHSTVTKMARYAATDLGADWVVNADADEFWVAVDPARTLREAIEAIDTPAPYVTVPVVNLTGAPAIDGTGLDRLRYRDLRSDDELFGTGIPFHPTADALHRAHPEVEIAQGNHFVAAPGWGDGGGVVDSIEVLHLPWRSWRQYEHKVRIAGNAYRANPELQPSPRHHGMQDFRRWEGGRLEHAYVAKHPTAAEIDALVASGSLVEDGRLAALADGTAPGWRADVRYEQADGDRLGETGRLLAHLEAVADARYVEMRDRIAEVEGERDEARREREWALGERENYVELLQAERSRFVVRAVDGIGRAVRAVTRRPAR